MRSYMCRLFDVSKGGYYAYLKQRTNHKRLPFAEKTREYKKGNHKTYS